MAVAWGCDYSYSRDSIDIAAMARDGIQFACRYLRDGAKPGKALLPAEAARLTGAGVAIVSNDETTGTQYLGGFDGGRRDARAALAAHLACGGPSNRPIYFTPLDHDPAGLDAAGWSTLRSYARGVVDVLGVARVGWYGGTRMLRDLKSRDLGRWWWQALGWREGIWLDWVHIQQYDNGNQRWNGEVDYDRALVADFGQWGTIMEGPMPLDASDKTYLQDQFDRVIHYLDHGDDTDGSKHHHAAIRADLGRLLGQQATEATVLATVLATVKTVIDAVKAGQGDLAAGIADLRSALLGAILALPGISDEKAQQIIDGVLAGIEAQGVTLDPAPVLEALRTHPLVPAP
jgi:Domain of unknown function (DUF1906)